MAPPPPSSSNPLAGLSSFMSGMVPPAPQQTNVRPPQAIKTAIRYPKPNPQPAAARAPAPAAAQPPPPPAREMKGPAVNIDDLLRSVNANVETKKVSTTPKKGGSTGKNSVTIKL
jgi:hypothetical protein